MANDSVVFIYDEKKYKLVRKVPLKIQEDLGADIVFAFDECTSPLHSYDYNKKSLKKNSPLGEKMLESEKEKWPSSFWHSAKAGFLEDLRRESSAVIGSLPFDGFGIGGSFGKTDGGSYRLVFVRFAGR